MEPLLPFHKSFSHSSPPPVISIPLSAHGRIHRGTGWTVPPKFEVGDGPCLRPPTFGKHYYTLYIISSPEGLPLLSNSEIWLRNVWVYASEMIFGPPKPKVNSPPLNLFVRPSFHPFVR